ncbi:group III truncated hemoglobin [Brevundimonas sp.]|uniref:group III truncated hemoglobin n=1 Tax=Brevundimonas sp. TaxID=1871086 RepID=UPI0035B36663
MEDPLPNDAEIAAVVDLFYDRVRRDPMLGPVFNAAVEDWPRHLHRLKAFWSTVMLASGRYKGDPMAAHLPHADAMTAPAFARWLSLWRATTNELLAAGPALAMQARAERIARNLSRAVVPETNSGDRGTMAP